MYPEELVYPMRKQLTDQGFDELKSIDDVENMVSNKGTTLVVVNSVCGCAAANARPGAITSLVNDKKPDHLTTVFAGVDRDAVEKVRYYLAPFPPSSPAIALFKDGELVHMLERHHIEGRSAELISCLLYTSPSPRDKRQSRMPSSA